MRHEEASTFKLIKYKQSSNLTSGTRKMLLTVTFIGTGPVGLIACHAIKTYHKNKPLGLQTLLSRTTVIFTNTVLLTGYSFALPFVLIELFGPFSELASMVLTVVPYTALNAFALSWLIMTITKYLSVYHNYWIANLDDNLIAKRICLALWIVPSISTLMEFSCLTRIQDTIGFMAARHGLEHVTASGSAKREILAQGLAVLVMLAVVILQFQIELNRYRNGETNSSMIQKLIHWLRHGNNDNIQVPSSTGDGTIQNFGYGIILLRIFTLLMLPVLVIMIAGTGDNIERNIMTGFIVSQAIAPLLVVTNHEGMRGIFFSQIRKCC